MSGKRCRAGEAKGPLHQGATGQSNREVQTHGGASNRRPPPRAIVVLARTCRDKERASFRLPAEVISRIDGGEDPVGNLRWRNQSRGRITVGSARSGSCLRSERFAPASHQRVVAVTTDRHPGPELLEDHVFAAAAPDFPPAAEGDVVPLAGPGDPLGVGQPRRRLMACLFGTGIPLRSTSARSRSPTSNSACGSCSPWRCSPSGSSPSSRVGAAAATAKHARAGAARVVGRWP